MLLHYIGEQKFFQYRCLFEFYVQCTMLIETFVIEKIIYLTVLVSSLIKIYASVFACYLSLEYTRILPDFSRLLGTTRHLLRMISQVCIRFIPSI